MYIKCYAYIDLCQRIEPKVSLGSAGTMSHPWKGQADTEHIGN